MDLLVVSSPPLPVTVRITDHVPSGKVWETEALVAWLPSSSKVQK
jgi:hypothetical protein